MLCLSNEFFIIRYAKINRPTRDDTEGALPVGYFELGQEAMLSLEDTVLLMVVLLVILLVTLTLAAVFRRRAHSGYVLGGWVTAFTSARGKKKHFVKEKKDKRVLTSVLQNRKEGKSPYINTSEPPTPVLNVATNGYTIQSAASRIENETNSTTLQFPCRSCNIVNAKRACSYGLCATCCHTKSNSICRAHGTGYLAAIRHSEAACTYRFTEFDLSYAHLKLCPSNVPLIGTQLVSLNLSNNRLESLPEDIGSLIGLQELFLQYNCLVTLPDSICELSNLVELDVKNNRLKRIPARIGDLKKLLLLSLTNNSILELPASIGNLEQLEELSLHANQLTQLPDELCRLQNLKILYTGENHYSTLPDRFGQLVTLEELDVSGCELVSLPDSITQCASLVRLWLSNNRLVVLPLHMGKLIHLKELHLRHNRLVYLPASIESLELYTFTVQNNCLVDEQSSGAHCFRPPEHCPPLLELAARAVLTRKSTWDESRVPAHLAAMLRNASWCSRCKGPLFTYFSSHIAFRTVGAFYRVPLYEQVCTPYSLSCHNT